MHRLLPLPLLLALPFLLRVMQKSMTENGKQVKGGRELTGEAVMLLKSPGPKGKQAWTQIPAQMWAKALYEL